MTALLIWISYIVQTSLDEKLGPYKTKDAFIYPCLTLAKPPLKYDIDE